MRYLIAIFLITATSVFPVDSTYNFYSGAQEDSLLARYPQVEMTGNNAKFIGWKGEVNWDIDFSGVSNLVFDSIADSIFRVTFDYTSVPTLQDTSLYFDSSISFTQTGLTFYRQQTSVPIFIADSSKWTFANYGTVDGDSVEYINGKFTYGFIPLVYDDANDTLTDTTKLWIDTVGGKIVLITDSAWLDDVGLTLPIHIELTFLMKTVHGSADYGGVDGVSQSIGFVFTGVDRSRLETYSVRYKEPSVSNGPDMVFALYGLGACDTTGGTQPQAQQMIDSSQIKLSPSGNTDIHTLSVASRTRPVLRTGTTYFLVVGGTDWQMLNDYDPFGSPFLHGSYFGPVASVSNGDLPYDIGCDGFWEVKIFDVNMSVGPPDDLKVKTVDK